MSVSNFHLNDWLSSKGFFNWMPDKAFLKMRYKRKFGKKLNLENPQNFNEKLQWLKLYDRKPEYTQMVDKYEAKKYVAERIGEEYIIPTLGVWEKFEDIDFDSLPNQFVLKCTHDSGGLVICRDKATFDKEAAKKKINKSLKVNYYLKGREWPYKNVKPRIIAEEYMEDAKTKELIDYKFYCFNGKVKYLYISEGLDNHSTAKISFVTLDWTFAPFNRSDYKPFALLPQEPFHFNEMIKIAEKLSYGINFMRVDLYEINEKVYFSELTFTPCSGFMPFQPKIWDLKLGAELELQNIKL